MSLTDLRERLARADDKLGDLANKAAAAHALTVYARIDGERQGVRLALSYVDEYLCDERDPDDEREMRLDGCSRLRPEGSTVDRRTGLAW